MTSLDPTTAIGTRDTRGRRPAEPATRERQRAAAQESWLADQHDVRDARRGFIATRVPLVILGADGNRVWDLADHDFLDSDAPDTVHPSLWRMARVNRIHGLFEVAPRIYQVRGFDISNLTVIVGARGYIVVDPLTCTETAAAAMELVRDTLGDRPITGMIFTHSHIDHFGGAGGIVEPDEASRIPVIAPVGFAHHAVVEHVNSGVAVSRRSQFMFGKRLPPGPRGQVSAGLGITLPSGRISLIDPNTLISHTGQEVDMDGLRLVFQFTPGAEAPTEVNFHIPELRALCMAETVSHHMHNLYTLRGAQVRDALAWSEYLDEAIRLFGDGSDVMFISHHWPVWGSDELKERIGEQRDLYRYIHDQTLRLANHGLTPTEAAEIMTLPAELHGAGNRGNYGSLSHNVKAVYQRYLGWFDANPANLEPLPPSELGERFVRTIGGRDAVLRVAAEAFEAGDYRWAAELLKHLLASSEDQDAEAAALQADVFEQLGYQSESGPWRNFYLLTAAELRGEAEPTVSFHASNAVMALGMDLAMLLDFVAIRLNGPQAAELEIELDVLESDRGSSRRVILRRGVLRHVAGATAAPSRLVASHAVLADLAMGSLALDDAVARGDVQLEGDTASARRLFAVLDDFAGDFSVTAAHRSR